MHRKITAIITAGGTGSRFSKSGKPKQYLNLNGIPIILYSLISFQKCKSVNNIIVAAGKEYSGLIHELALKNNISKLTMLVEGGKTRFESVRNAFMEVDISTSYDIVIIHDAARPYIDAYFIERLVYELDKFDGVIPCLKVNETVKKAKNGIVTETVDRENLYTAQTPQVFRYKALKESYKRCGRKNDFTDEAALLENAGFKVKIAEGNMDNIKITTSEDIRVFKSAWLNPLKISKRK